MGKSKNNGSAPVAPVAPAKAPETVPVSSLMVVEPPKPPAPKVGEVLISFHWKGKDYAIDRAFFRGNRILSLIHIKEYCKIHNVTMGLPEATPVVKKFNTEVKSAFYAYCQYAEENGGDYSGVGIFQKANGDIVTTVKRTLTKAEKDAKEAIATAQPNQLTDGSAKAEKISRSKAKRQANKAAKAAEPMVPPARQNIPVESKPEPAPVNVEVKNAKDLASLDVKK